MAVATIAYRAVADRLVDAGLMLVRDVLVAHEDERDAEDRARLAADVARTAREIAAITE